MARGGIEHRTHHPSSDLIAWAQSASSVGPPTGRCPVPVPGNSRKAQVKRRIRVQPELADGRRRRLERIDELPAGHRRRKRLQGAPKPLQTRPRALRVRRKLGSRSSARAPSSAKPLQAAPLTLQDLTKTRCKVPFAHFKVVPKRCKVSRAHSALARARSALVRAPPALVSALPEIISARSCAISSGLDVISASYESAQTRSKFAPTRCMRPCARSALVHAPSKLISARCKVVQTKCNVPDPNCKVLGSHWTVTIAIDPKSSIPPKVAEIRSLAPRSAMYEML
jgi:hypothetical protein